MSVGKSYKEYQKCTFNKIWVKSRHSHVSVFWGQKGQGPHSKNPKKYPIICSGKGKGKEKGKEKGKGTFFD